MSAGGFVREVGQRLLRGLGSAIYRCGRGMRQNLLIQGVAVGTVALMLLLCGTVRLCSENVGRLLGGLGRNAEMIVYLTDGIAPARAQQLSEALRKLPGVTQVHTVTQKEAYERLRKGLGERADLLDGVEEDLLPSSIEVGFRSGVSDILRVHPIYSRLRNTEGVEDVELMSDWVRRLLLLRRLLLYLGWSVGLMVALCCLYIVSATIRLGIYARRDEIEVMRQVGATGLYIEAPFLLEGLMQGVVGTALGAALLYGLYALALPPAQALLHDVLGDVDLTFLPGGDILWAMGLMGLLGIAGSTMAVGRHMRG